jgi:hypothetical protein
MKIVRPPPVRKDTWQIIAEANADIEWRKLVGQQFDADVCKLREPLSEARRLLQEIGTALERIKHLR